MVSLYKGFARTSLRFGYLPSVYFRSRSYTMAVLTGLIVIVASLIAFADSTPLEQRATVEVSNAKTSLSLIYQNNLNGSDASEPLHFDSLNTVNY